MENITRDIIDFVEKARIEFEADEKLSTYRNDGLIALRTGLFDDSILVFELGDEIGLFAHWLKRSE